MEGFRWILLGLGVLVIAGIYLYSRQRRDGRVRVPLQDEPGEDPIDWYVGENAARESEADPALDINTDDVADEPDRFEPTVGDEGVGPVRRPGADSAPESAPEAGFQPEMPELRTRDRGNPAQPPAEPEAPDAPGESAEPATVGSGESTEQGGSEEILVVLHLVARDVEVGMPGEAIRRAAEAEGLVFGDMDIFHYRADGHALFSLVNAVAPGHFDIESMDSLRTPALSLFMQLPKPVDSAMALDILLERARALAERLDARLVDEHKRPLDASIEQRLREQVAFAC